MHKLFNPLLIDAAELQRQRQERGQPGEALQPVHARDLRAAGHVQRQRLEGGELAEALQPVDVGEVRT